MLDHKDNNGGQDRRWRSMFGEWQEKEKAQENAKKMTEKKGERTFNKIKTGNTGAERERKDTVNIHRRT